MSLPSQQLDIAIAHHQAGRLREAELLYRKILQATPHQVDALHLLGVALHQIGRHDEAIDYIRQAVAQNPRQPNFHNSLGSAFQAQGNWAEAVACYSQSLSLAPDYAEAHNNLGMALFEMGKLKEAEASLRQAVSIRPDYAKAHNNLGIVLRALGRIAEATAYSRRAAELRESSWEAHHCLGTLLKDQGLIAEALFSYERALQLQPNNKKAHGNFLCVLQYRAGITLHELANLHADFERKFAAPLRSTWKPHDNDPDPERRLRLGFVSADLERHPVGYFLVRCLENLDRQHAEAVCYSGSTAADDLTARIRSAAAAWRDASKWSDEQLAKEIRTDRIDILFDLGGHTGRNRLLAFARKPAPIQVTWAGYVGTTGLAAIDYILADRFEIPPDAERHYTERLLRMPDGYVCYDPPAYAPPVTRLPALEKGYVTFGSFNNAAKLGPQVVEAWSRILQRLPNARLVLKYKGMDDPAIAGRLAEMFAGNGIDPARVACLGWSPHADLLAAYGNIDIGLDPSPYNGGLTTLEALWMGVPVVTCPGETFAGRHSLTHLSNAGLTRTIAGNLDEYVELAVSLAEDLPGLAALRAGLREQLSNSPLCDGERFARNFMQLMRGAWREWVGTKSQS